jgi:quercetin dioxygenase-like cupin family protein
VHPNGDEVIHLVSGSMLVSVELGDSDHEVQLVTGQTLVIPANTWHRHVAVDPAAVLFVTPIRDTKQRLVAGSDHVHETTGLDTAS